MRAFHAQKTLRREKMGMNMNIGSAVRRLRTENGLTQEAVAEYLGVSFQAVSKWETGVTLPDITLLPTIAACFGVRIDDLFSVDHEDERKRIDHLLRHDKLCEQSYHYAKHTLDVCLQDDPDDVDAMKLYAMLHYKRANDDLLEAGRMLESAMKQAPLDAEIFSLYRMVRGGQTDVVRSGNDWFIRICEPYAKEYPENELLRKMLIEAMVDMKYFERAEELINIAPFETESEYRKAVFLGDIEAAKGNLAQAIKLWSTVPKDSNAGQYEVGERYNRINEYERAIECFQNSFKAAHVPRYLDPVFSLAFLYTKLGRKAEAVEAWKLIINVLASDHNDVDSETVKWAENEIAKLERSAG